MAELKSEQREAVYHEGGNVVVSASAGSGKTFTMIERAKRLIIERGISVSEILAVTFTEMAAADMKEKLRKALSEEVANNPTERLKEQFADVSNADICTLHSFCGRLIRLYFFEVGLSPDFKIIDTADTNIMRIECVDKAFREFYDSGEEWFYTLVDRHAVGRSDKKLKEIILSAYEFCDSEAYPDEFMDGFIEKSYSEQAINDMLTYYKNVLYEKIESLKERAEEALDAFKGEGLIKAQNFTKTLIADFDDLLSEDDVYAVKRFEEYALKLDFERKISDQAKYFKDIVSECRDEFKKLTKRFAKNLTTPEEDKARHQALKEHTENLIKIVKRFSKIYAEEKREENVLDFNDLEHFALRILKNEEIRRAVSEKYKHVFVDEYQDVNGVQEEIISLISNNNAFMVGDVKQSIYGFRGCRPEIFAKKFIDAEKNGGKAIRLNYNFRSTNAILSAVNEIFNFCMLKKHFGENYKDGSQLQSGGIYGEDCSGRAELHFLKKEDTSTTKEESPRIYDILEEINNLGEKPSSKIASLITKIINDELTKTYYDPKDKCYKKVQYGDIAILSRAKNSAYTLELTKNLIRHGIPVQSDVKENVCDFYEISVLISALKAIDCFEQDIPLATVLKSPIGKFSDEDLIQIVRFYLDENNNKKAGFFTAYKYYIERANTSLAERLKSFEEYFNSIRVLSDFIGAKGALEKIIKDKDLESYFMAENNGKSKVNRILRFLSSTATGDRKLTVSEVLSRVETCPEAFGFTECGEEDTVKFMTIHASKGLEFPVVIVCGLERTMNDDQSDEVVFSREYGFAVKYYDDQTRQKHDTILRGIIREKARVENMKEEMRLFYVATTRATNSMHLIFEAKEDNRQDFFKGAEHFIDFVPYDFPLTEHLPESLQFNELKKGVRKVLIGEPDENAMGDMSANFAHKYAFTAETTLPLKTSVTATLKGEEEQFNKVFVLFDEPAPDKEKGVIAHKILECMDFNRLGEFDEQVLTLVEKEIISEEQKNSLSLERIKRAVMSGVFDNLEGFSLYREKAFLASVPANKIMDTESDEGVLVQGIIDLLAIKDGVARIIDYKYSSLNAESLKAQYKKQLELYAYAVEKVLLLKVERKTLVNIFTGETVDV